MKIHKSKCVDHELQADMDYTNTLRERMLRLEPDAHCTYHHAFGGCNGFWQSHIWGVPLSGECATQRDALIAGIAALENDLEGEADEAD